MKLGLLTSIRKDIPNPGEYLYKRLATNLAPMYLAAYLQKMGVGVEVQIRDKLEDLGSFRPDVLGISSVTENIEYAKELAALAKEKWNSLTLLGGVHITALPHTLPKEFDIGVIGEGEETLCEVLQQVEGNKVPPQEALAKINGIVFHTSQGVQQTPIRKGIRSLDQIPPPDRSRYIKKTGLTYMMTSRGCPYTCNFCVIPSISEGYRTHSPEYVVEEIRSIKRDFPFVKHIRIFDDLYIVDRKRVAQIAERIAAEGLHQDLSFGCWGRANLIDEATAKMLQKMNMLYVAFGAESGSSRVMSQIKPGSSVEKNQRAIDLLHEQGIQVTCSIILGHPTETEEDLWATYEFIEKNLEKVFEVEFNVAIPWPGTELWLDAKRRGIVSDFMDFNQLKECAFFPNYCTENHPYLNEQMSPERFEVILASFKKLFWKMSRKMEGSRMTEGIIYNNEMASLY